MCGSKRVHSGGMNHAIDGARKRDKKEGEIKVKNKKKIDEKKNVTTFSVTFVRGANGEIVSCDTSLSVKYSVGTGHARERGM